MYQVKTKQFEGPLSLLLDLIERQKMDITELSITQVADDFLEYIEDRNKIDLAGLSEFLAIASQLILLKSKALLPLFEFTKEEEEEIEDLEARLKEYQRFKLISEKVNIQFASPKISFSKEEEKKLIYSKFSPPGISTENLHEIFISILQEIPTKQELQQQIVEEIVSLEDKIIHLKATIESRMKIAFHETVDQAGDKIDVVMTFLAMLEMIKQKVITVQQTELFGEIIMARSNSSKKQENA